jgi:dUTP pyrophosphatase
MKIEVKILHSEAKLPTQMTDGASGFDLHACLSEWHDEEYDERLKPFTLRIQPGHHLLIKTGIAIEIPTGFEGQVRPRSGLALRHGVTVLNAPGTIDSDYRGEIGVLLINHGDEPFSVCHGDRIAQLVIAPVARFELAISRELSDTERGQGGFGSTGVNKDRDEQR